MRTIHFAGWSAFAFGSTALLAATGQGWVKPYDASPSYGYFSTAYATSESRQHLGVDIGASAGSKVYSPVDGLVVEDKTAASDIMKAYMVIRDSATGQEHVLGHVTAVAGKNAKVTRGQEVARVRDWGTNSHVHWGVNTVSIAGAMGWFEEGEWGWGRAPVGVTRKQASGHGWVDPWNAGVSLVSQSSLSSRSTTASPSSSGATSARSSGNLAATRPATPTRPLPGRNSDPGNTLPGERITISWGSVKDATEYDLSIRDMTDKKSVSVSRQSSTYYTLRAKSGHTYRWSVQACNEAGCSEASERLYFTVK